MSERLLREQDVIDAITDELDRIDHVPQWVVDRLKKAVKEVPSAEPQIVRCKDCKHNPNEEWFGCPMSHLSEKQRPDNAWCWKGERRTDG